MDDALWRACQVKSCEHLLRNWRIKINVPRPSIGLPCPVVGPTIGNHTWSTTMQKMKPTFTTAGRQIRYSHASHLSRFLIDKITRHKTQNDTCRQDVATAQNLPPPVVKAVPLTYISTKSSPAKGMTALCAVGLGIELTFMVLFAWKRNTPVIKAASRIPSMLIFIGMV